MSIKSTKQPISPAMEVLLKRFEVLDVYLCDIDDEIDSLEIKRKNVSHDIGDLEAEIQTLEGLENV